MWGLSQMRLPDTAALVRDAQGFLSNPENVPEERKEGSVGLSMDRETA